MNRTQQMAYNAALTSTELIETVAGNIAGYGTNGHRAKRWSFNDFVNGGDINHNGYSWRQGPQEPRVGEWTKLMIKGMGLFSLRDPRTNQNIYTRLGDFHIDGEGNMVSPEGLKVQGIPLAGAYTTLNGPDTRDPDTYGNPHFGNVFRNTKSHNAQSLNAPGQAVGQPQDINLKLDPRNGRYLGKFEKITVGEDGVIYGKAGKDLVSLYKIQVVNFNNPGGLRNVRDGIYWKATEASGYPTFTASESTVLSEALEKSNVWTKVEVDYLTKAQRYYQASTQLHKLADKISGTAIEMIQ